MATERQQVTLRQLIKDVERYAREIYGLDDRFLHECDWHIEENWFYLRMEHC